MELHFKEEMKKTIDALLANHKLTGKTVFAFGHCNATEEMLDYLSGCGITVNAILDNNKSKQGGHYNGVPIVPPQYIAQYRNRHTVVLIAARFFEPMSVQLKKLDYNGEIVKVVDYNTFAEYALSDDTVKRKTDRMLRGAETLKRIREQFPQEHLVICPNQALGDVYWTCAYLPAYCAKKKIESVAIVVIGSGCRQVAELFGMTDVVMLDRTDMDELVQATIFNHEENCIIAHHDRPYTDNIIKYLDRHLLTFTDYYKYAVFGLSKDAAPVKPWRPAEFDNKAELKAPIIKNKSIIIAPYAKSVVQPSREFWGNMVNEYKKQGFHIYTNVFGDEEPLAHTTPIALPLNQLIRAAEYAGHFIGLRSGVCDVVNTANCRKTVIMPDCIYSTTYIKVADFFALPGWEEIIV
jgi:hypothetical protein